MVTIAATDIDLKVFTKYGVTFYGYCNKYRDVYYESENLYYYTEDGVKMYVDGEYVTEDYLGDYFTYFYYSDTTGERVYDSSTGWHYFTDMNNVQYIDDINQYILDNIPQKECLGTTTLKVVFMSDSETDPSESPDYYDYNLNWNYTSMYWYTDENNKWVADAEIETNVYLINGKIEWSFDYPKCWVIKSLYRFSEYIGGGSGGGSMLLKTIDFRGADDLSNIISMEQAFQYCNDLETVNFSKSILNNITTLDYAFNGCCMLKPILLNQNTTFENLESAYNIFSLESNEVKNDCGIDFVRKMITAMSDYQLSTLLEDMSLCFIQNHIQYLVTDDDKVVANLYVSENDSGNVVIYPTVLEFDVVNISDGTFKYNTNLKNVEIRLNITEMPCFRECTGLLSVVVPNTVTKINRDGFLGCTGLQTVNFLDNITEIEFDAFKDCTGLTRVDFANLDNLCKIDFTSNTSNPLYYAHNLYINNVLVTNITIPNNITTIKRSTFTGCTGVTSFTIPNNITSIRESAFEGCTGITSISIPSNVAYVYQDAFKDCTGLTRVDFASVSNVYQDAFKNCTGLTRVDFASVSSLCGIKFYSPTANPSYFARNIYVNNTLLTNVTVPNNITSLMYNFVNCPNIVSITIPSTTVVNPAYMFFGCENLETLSRTIKLDEGCYETASFITNSLVRMFTNCKKITNLNDVVSTTITESYVYISSFYEMFSGCVNLTGDIVFNQKFFAPTTRNYESWANRNYKVYATSSMSKMFNDCRKITSFTFKREDSGEIKIMASTTDTSYMFCNCVELTDVDMSSVVSYDYYDTQTGRYYHHNVNATSMFENCASLQNLKKLGSALHVGAATNMLKGCSALTTITGVWFCSDVSFVDCDSLPIASMIGCLYNYNTPAEPDSPMIEIKASRYDALDLQTKTYYDNLIDGKGWRRHLV